MPRPVVERDPDRAKLMRGAGDLLGSEALGRALGIKPRTIFALMAGERTVSDGVLADTRKLLIEHRQRVGMLIQLIRDHEAKGEVEP